MSERIPFILGMKGNVLGFAFRNMLGMLLQGGPLLVRNGAIIPLSRVISSQLPIYFRPCIGVIYIYITSFITIVES